MNRRSFLDGILKAGVAAAILPAAKTYQRLWSGVIVPRGTFEQIITARYVFDKEKGVSVKVMHGGEEYKSLIDAARAIAKQRGCEVPAGTASVGRIHSFRFPGCPQVAEGDLQVFDVHVLYEGKPMPEGDPFTIDKPSADLDGNIVIRRAIFQNVPA